MGSAGREAASPANLLLAIRQTLLHCLTSACVQGGGMPLKGPIRSIYSFPTIVIFCEGLGIAAARALIEAEPAVGSLSFPLRQDVRLYYRVRPS